MSNGMGCDPHRRRADLRARRVWTPVDPVGLAVSSADLRRSLELVRDAGMNMLRIPGTGLYETAEFHDLCDELGILVWQDLLFANLDYPFADDAFRTLVDREVAEVLAGLARGRAAPSSAATARSSSRSRCSGSIPRSGVQFFDEEMSAAANDADLDAVLVPSAPFGGDLPFRPDRGVANYYGVGGYRRPMSDARTAGVRFAAECLAFSNIPRWADHGGFDDPAWKAGVPRDRGADWDFEDVGTTISSCSTGSTRRPSGATTLRATWRCRGRSAARSWPRCSVSGAAPVADRRRARAVVARRGARRGLGPRRHRGTPKTAYHQLRHVLAPVAIWTDRRGARRDRRARGERRPGALVARLRVALYRDREVPVGAGEQLLEVGPHGSTDLDVEAVIGHFVDASWAYRFGPPAQDLIVGDARAIDGDGARPIGQAFRFPLGRPSAAETAVVAGPGRDLVEHARRGDDHRGPDAAAGP